MTRRARSVLASVACACIGAGLLAAPTVVSTQATRPAQSQTAPLPPTRVIPPASEHAAGGVSFEDITAAAGLSGFRHVSGGADKRYIIEATGSGVGAWDFDNDGLVDIYLVNGSTIDAQRRGAPAPRAALYRNVGKGVFRDVTDAMGVGNLRWGQGVCVGDIDNDGFEDIYVANFGKNRLYRHTARGGFEDIADKAGVAVDSWSTGCAFGDFDGDGWLDLFVAGYVDLDLAHPPPSPLDSAAPTPTPTPSAASSAAAAASAAASAPSEAQAGGSTGAGAGMGASYTPGAAVCTYRGERVICGPRGLKGAPDHLFRNNHDGTFTDVSVQAGVADTDGRYGFGVAWFDFDDDGRLDLMVANDSGPNYVYRNLGNGKFADVSYQSGAALDGDGRSQAHMGLAIGDYDNDGRDDVHITNFADDFNVLYHNDGKGSFSDVSFPSGLASVTLPFLGWGTHFFDYDNDGWLDIFVANGHVYPTADRLDWNTSYAQRALLFRNLGGLAAAGASDASGAGGGGAAGAGVRFEEIGAAAGAALTTPRVARGSAVADLDNDGGLDIIINTLDGPPLVARNVSTTTATAAASAQRGVAAGSGAAAGTGAAAAAGAGAGADGAAGAAAGRGHWLTVSLRGDPKQNCPRDAIGSTVFVTAGGRRMRGEVASGRGQISQSDLRVHFGLGPATSVTKLEVHWANSPGGKTTEYAMTRIDAILTIDQASGSVK
jgi:enediyne biosynthesis protein E4